MDKEYLDAVQEKTPPSNTDARISALESRLDQMRADAAKTAQNPSAKALSRLSWASVALVFVALAALLYWIFKPKPSPVRVLVPLPEPPSPELPRKPVGFLAHSTPATGEAAKPTDETPAKR